VAADFGARSLRSSHDLVAFGVREGVLRRLGSIPLQTDTTALEDDQAHDTAIWYRTFMALAGVIMPNSLMFLSCLT